jgi:hypothetical protein
MITEQYELKNDYIRSHDKVKDKIVLCHSYSYDTDHIEGWNNRSKGNLYSITPFSVGRDGEVYQHFNPCLTHSLISDRVDPSIIGITLVNIGPLTLNPYNGSFNNWLYDVHHGDELVSKEWRGYHYWEAYTSEQQTSVFQLVTYLLSEYNIAKYIVPHNTKVDNAEYTEGVLYRSNFNKNYLDLSPAWDYDGFKNKFEKTHEDGSTVNK